MKCLVVFCVVLFFCAGCYRTSIEEEYARILKGEVSVSFDDMQCIGNLSVVNRDVTEYLFVSYIGENQCSTCRLGSLYAWENYINDLRDMGIDVANVVIIHHPKNSALDKLRKSILSHRFKFGVYIDSIGIFKRNNPFLSDITELNTFLLNSDGKPVVVGNPTNNE